MENRSFQVRTDLALEEKESFEGEAGELSGVALREWERKESGVKLTEVRILNAQGAKTMGKPVGTYLTLEAARLSKPDDEYHSQISEELAVQLRRLIAGVIDTECEHVSVLVAGLGNSSVTPDSLGPRVLSNLHVTRRLSDDKRTPVISGIAPGVMAQTGMETAEILQGIIKETRPQLVIAIDALAARSVRRLFWKDSLIMLQR